MVLVMVEPDIVQVATTSLILSVFNTSASSLDQLLSVQRVRHVSLGPTQLLLHRWLLRLHLVHLILTVLLQVLQLYLHAQALVACVQLLQLMVVCIVAKRIGCQTVRLQLNMIVQSLVRALVRVLTQSLHSAVTVHLLAVVIMLHALSPVSAKQSLMILMMASVDLVLTRI